jgi:hypothetical protein
MVKNFTRFSCSYRRIQKNVMGRLAGPSCCLRNVEINCTHACACSVLKHDFCPYLSRSLFRAQKRRTDILSSVLFKGDIGCGVVIQSFHRVRLGTAYIVVSRGKEARRDRVGLN